MNYNRSQRIKQKRIAQKNLERQTLYRIIIHVIIILAIMLETLMIGISDKITEFKSQEAKSEKHHIILVERTHDIEKQEPEEEKPMQLYNISNEDAYLLAKLAMSEAEGCSVDCKVCVIMCAINRVNEPTFPDTIHDVIYQQYDGVYQFTPVPTSRWQLEPNAECWEAIEIVKAMTEDISTGATYFESCASADNWHSRNLTFLFEIDGMRFYK